MKRNLKKRNLKESKKNMRKEQGFTLIELLIVVAIIAIIAAIAIPNLLVARMAANETSAIGNLRNIGSAIATYTTMEGAVPASWAALQGSAGGSLTPYIDSRFGEGEVVNGFKYSSTATAPTATPAIPAWGSGAFIYLTAIPDAGMGRWGYGTGSDVVIRFGTALTGYTLPGGNVAGNPVGKTTAATP